MKWSRRCAVCLVLCIIVLPRLSPGREPDPQILRIQESLHERGYDPGPIDGVMGKKTRKAIKAFQRSIHLPATGVVDTATRVALQRTGASVAKQKSKPLAGTSPTAKIPEPEPPPLVMAVVPLVYKPPQRGAPGSRIAAGVRAEGNKVPLLYALAPEDHIGLTIQEQPSLYWYLSEPTNYKIELTIVDEQAIQPLFVGALPLPTHVGIQQVRLADYGVRLPLGTQYKWFVSVVPDPDSRLKDIAIGGGIQRIEPPEALRTRLLQAKKEEIPALYAEAGIWYDALMTITELIDAAQSESDFRAERATLLKQVGLQEVAAHER